MHEVISTIMLNWVAVSLVDNWLVVGPLRAGAGTRQSTTGTAEILPTAHLPRLLGELSRLHLGFPLALAVAVALWVWLARMRHGLRDARGGTGRRGGPGRGHSRGPAHRVGPWGWPERSRAWPGRCSCWAPSSATRARSGRPTASTASPSRSSATTTRWGSTLSALFFGTLRAGGTRMQLLGVHKSFPELIQGLALLFVAGRLVWLALLRVRRRPPWRAQSTEARRRCPVLEVLEALLSSTLDALPALVFAALGAVLSERAGVVNVGVEGMMRTGAFCAAVAALSMPTPLGVLVGMLAGAGMAAVHGFLCIRWRSDQVVSGMALNLVALAGGTFLLESLYGPNGTPAHPAAHALAPRRCSRRCPSCARFSGHSALTYLALVLPFALPRAALPHAPGPAAARRGREARTPWPRSACPWRGLRWFAVLGGGPARGPGRRRALHRGAGPLRAAHPRGPGLHGPGRHGVRPLDAAGRASSPPCFFSAGNALRIGLASSAPGLLEVVPQGFLLALPYLLTLLLLAVQGRRTHAPAALGTPYEQESR